MSLISCMLSQVFVVVLIKGWFYIEFESGRFFFFSHGNILSSTVGQCVWSCSNLVLTRFLSWLVWKYYLMFECLEHESLPPCLFLLKSLQDAICLNLGILFPQTDLINVVCYSSKRFVDAKIGRVWNRQKRWDSYT